MKNLNYYEKKYAEKIFSSRPILCNKPRSYGVRMLTCEKDLLITFWALKSFYFYLNDAPKLYVHDDGSLTKKTIELYKEHFKGCEVIEDSRPLQDKNFHQTFKSQPLSSIWRFKTRYPFSKRIFDFSYYSKENFYLTIDSDILFFNKPLEIMNLVKSGTSFMSRDCLLSYVAPSSSSLFGEKFLRIAPIPYLNAGLSFFNKDMFNRQKIEEFVNAYIETSPEKLFYYGHHLLEQTLSAWLFTVHGGKIVLPISKYQISSMLLTDKTVSQHFVSDKIVRPLFFHWGLSKLEEKDFLKKLNSKIP